MPLSKKRSFFSVNALITGLTALLCAVVPPVLSFSKYLCQRKKVDFRIRGNRGVAPQLFETSNNVQLSESPFLCL